MSGNPDQRREAAEAGRRRAVRTAVWLAVLAAAVYVAFILSGVIGR